MGRRLKVHTVQGVVQQTTTVQSLATVKMRYWSSCRLCRVSSDFSRCSPPVSSGLHTCHTAAFLQLPNDSTSGKVSRCRSTDGFFAILAEAATPQLNHTELLPSEKWRIINLLDDIPDAFTRGRIIEKLEEDRSVTRTAIRGSVVVVHEEPHPQMTGTLSYRPEETGGRQREKSLDTQHRRLDDQYRIFTVARRLHGGGLFARRPVGMYLNACPSEKGVLCGAGNTELRETNEWGRVLFTDESRFSLSSDSHRILHLERAGKPQSSLEHH
ncbi:hypothetical protein TNCV_3360341 [Trichonephila clavipes]|nr:hypothetical protein TNCV_3360341 [Trichonephila clavipes]